jgi:hypothetical protein
MGKRKGNSGEQEHLDLSDFLHSKQSGAELSRDKARRRRRRKV